RNIRRPSFMCWRRSRQLLAFHPPMNPLLSIALFTVSMFSAIMTGAAEPAVDLVAPADFAELINDHNLTGWQDPANAAAHWKIENGELINDGQGADLVTVKSYRNFELRLEWKIPPKGDSGVYLP